MTDELTQLAPMAGTGRGIALSPEDNLPAAPDISTIIANALEKNVGGDQLMALLNFQREVQKDAAKAEFLRAMSAFQSECPVVEKRAAVTGRNDKVMYRFAPLEHMVTQVQPLLDRHGFSYRFDTTWDETGCLVDCAITHIAGHSEKTGVRVPTGSLVQNANAAQNAGAAVTYGKRYSFMNGFGILTADEDVDARQLPEDTITDEEAEALSLMCDEIADFDQARFFKWCSQMSKRDVAVFEDIPARNYKAIYAEVDRRRSGQ